MNQEAIKKMRLAKKYQKEAMMELVPEEIRGNVTAIEREMKEITQKCFTKVGLNLMKVFLCKESEESKEEQSAQSVRVKKVEIG